MSKNAARQSIDKAGHDGPLTSGSSNVFTGGFPATRMGDIFTCKEHGPGVISEGSKTVTINGLPAARYGDKVLCGNKKLPPRKSPKPPEYHFATLAKKTYEDGSILVKDPEEFQINVLLASAKLSDTDGDGDYDVANNKISLEDFQLNHSLNNSNTNLNIGGAIGKAEIDSGTISNEKESSGSVNAKATGVSGNIGISSGKEGTGDYGGIKAEGTVGAAEAKGEIGAIYDNDELNYGINFELGAEAAAAKGEISGSVESKYFKMKGAVNVSAGSVGAALGAGLWTDVDNFMLKLKLVGELAAILGVKGDIEIQIGPFTDVPLHELLTSPTSSSGVILSGASNVIIGG
ncbi:PAAR domain-containing protein [Trabulsiella odontotermitis]|uniref:PAAR domain-containing protein n=1 Tax=Trabulsiella odontotermitis TaxID=379893 RepID=UPI00092D2C4F|nr:PAAR domain-containing protein [Trabulsiella odontotermitis]